MNLISLIMNFISLRDVYDLYKFLTGNELYDLYKSAFDETEKKFPLIKEKEGHFSQINDKEIRSLTKNVEKYIYIDDFKEEILTIYRNEIGSEIPESELRKFLDCLLKNLDKKIVSNPEIREKLVYLRIEDIHQRMTGFFRAGFLYMSLISHTFLTQYTYDSLGNLTSFTDANGNTTLYRYDSIFGITQVAYPDLTIETFSYDDIGNMLLGTDGNGITEFTYNDIYQLIEVIYPDQYSVAFQYDEYGNMTLMTDPAGSTSYIYDNRNRRISETRTIAGESYTVSYTFDAASRLASITYPDQSVITHEYDSLNRIVSIPGYAQFTYNDDSLLDSVTYNNGTSTSYQYDIRDRPVTIHTEKNDPLLIMMKWEILSQKPTLRIHGHTCTTSRIG